MGLPRTVGLVGGIGPESTIEYYRQIIAACRERAPDGYPPILINSIDLTRMLALFAANRLAEVTDYLAGEVDRLARAGATFAAMTSNTPHLVFDEVSRRSPIPMISIVETTCAAARARGLRTVGLFGTRFTMQGPFYPEGLAREGIALVVPEPGEQIYIHDKYLAELLKGIVVPETRERLLAIADRMQEQHGIESLILGGTDLPLILRGATPRGLPFLDTTALHVERIVAELLA